MKSIKYTAIGRWGIMKSYIGVVAAISIFISILTAIKCSTRKYISLYFYIPTSIFSSSNCGCCKEKDFYDRLLHMDVTRNSLFECCCNTLVMELIYSIFNDLFSIYRLDEKKEIFKRVVLFIIF